MRKLKKPYSQNWRGLSAKWLFILSTVLGIIAFLQDYKKSHFLINYRLIFYQ